MSNIPDRVVLLRVARDPDDKDKDDKSSSSSVSVSQTQTPTPQPKPPGPPGPPRPETSPSTLSTITQSSYLPTITESSTSTRTPDPTAAPYQESPTPDSFGPAESAGIGVGVAVAVLLLALVAWLIARRRRSSKMRKISVSSTADTEVGNKEYGPVGVKELEAGRRASELAAHTGPVEVVGDPEFVAELQGSDTPIAGWRKPDRERLFVDAPINETDDHDELGFSKINDEKRGPDDHKESDFNKTDIKKQDS